MWDSLKCVNVHAVLDKAALVILGGRDFFCFGGVPRFT
jgi:hypothetical protein